MATSAYIILRVVDNLKTILAPILPHTANRLHEHLRHDVQLFSTRQAVEYPKKRPASAGSAAVRS